MDLSQQPKSDLGQHHAGRHQKNIQGAIRIAVGKGIHIALWVNRMHPDEDSRMTWKPHEQLSGVAHGEVNLQVCGPTMWPMVAASRMHYHSNQGPIWGCIMDEKNIQAYLLQKQKKKVKKGKTRGKKDTMNELEVRRRR
jgi:hypothetical protein